MRPGSTWPLVSELDGEASGPLRPPGALPARHGAAKSCSFTRSQHYRAVTHRAGWAFVVQKSKAGTLRAATALRHAADARTAVRREVLLSDPRTRTDTALEVLDELLVNAEPLKRLTRAARVEAGRWAQLVLFDHGQVRTLRAACLQASQNSATAREQRICHA
jgi:hypothetical protein